MGREFLLWVKLGSLRTSKPGFLLVNLDVLRRITHSCGRSRAWHSGPESQSRGEGTAAPGEAVRAAAAVVRRGAPHSPAASLQAGALLSS